MVFKFCLYKLHVTDVKQKLTWGLTTGNVTLYPWVSSCQVSKECGFFIFRVTHSFWNGLALKMKAPLYLWNGGNCPPNNTLHSRRLTPLANMLWDLKCPEKELLRNQIYVNILSTLTIHLIHILSLLLFTVRNKNHFQVNSEIYHTDTRQHANFHQPSVNITKYQKAAYCVGVKVYNILPSYIKTESDNPKKFKTVLQNFLYKHSFYSLDEYFQLQKG